MRLYAGLYLVSVAIGAALFWHFIGREMQWEDNGAPENFPRDFKVSVTVIVAIMAGALAPWLV
jgi:hypothetical protein